jgi:hypothetical protein
MCFFHVTVAGAGLANLTTRGIHPLKRQYAYLMCKFSLLVKSPDATSSASISSRANLFRHMFSDLIKNIKNIKIEPSCERNNNAEGDDDAEPKLRLVAFDCRSLDQLLANDVSHIIEDENSAA